MHERATVLNKKPTRKLYVSAGWSGVIQQAPKRACNHTGSVGVLFIELNDCVCNDPVGNID